VRDRRLRFALALAAAVAAIGVLLAHRYERLKIELTEAALSRRAATGALAATALADKFELLTNLGISLATRVRFRELIEAGRWEEAARILRGVPADFSFIDRVFLADPAGTQMAAVPALAGAVGHNFAHRDWYRGVSREWKPYVSTLYRRAAEPRRTVFAVAVPIRGDSAAVAGILVMEVKPESVFAWARPSGRDPASRLLIVDRDGRVAFDTALESSPESEAPDASALIRAIGASAPGARLAQVGFDGEEVIAGYVAASHGWGVLTVQPAQAAFAARDALLRQLLFDGAAISLLAAAAIALAAALAAQHRRAADERRYRSELERQVAERTAQLASANRELADLYDNAPCGYHSVDAEGRIVRMNRTWLDWLGCSAEEVVGKKFHPDLMTPQSAAQFRDKWFPLFLAQGVLKDVEFEYVRSDGSIFAGSLQATAIRDDTGRYVASRSVVVDISERKRMEREIRALNAELERRAGQLEAANRELEAFSYSVSHDLRAPLRAVDGYARMLEEDCAARLDDEGRRLLAVVRSESARMGRLIDDLLAFSRSGRQPLRVAELDMTALAREVVAELSPRYPSAAVELAPLPAAAGDRALLRQVWLNLVGNALKYSAKRADPRIAIGGRVAGAEVEYWVRDNGAGFDPRYAAKLFGVFQRLHGEEEFPGTGVGLAIVQRIVLRHGGRVRAEGAPGEGARFAFVLPARGEAG
jgi:PAS domain S-box-containing protein